MVMNESGRFIVGAMDDVWLAELKKRVTIHADVFAINKLKHLCTHCLGAQEVKIFETLRQNQYNVTMDLIPWYIDAIEKAKKTSKRAVNGTPVN